MFLTHNVVNVSWPEGVLTDDLFQGRSASQPLSPAAATTWKNGTRETPAHHASPVCVRMNSPVSWRGHGQRRMDRSIPVIAKMASLHPSWSLWSQTELLLRLTDTDWPTERRTSLHADRQTDGQTGLCCISELDSLTTLWVSISDHKPSALDAVPCAPQWPSCQCSLTVSTVRLKEGGQRVCLPVHTEKISLTCASVPRGRRQQQAGFGLILSLCWSVKAASLKSSMRSRRESNVPVPMARHDHND